MGALPPSVSLPSLAMASQVDYISEQPKETRQPQVAPVVEGEVDEFEEHGDGRVSLPTWATVKHKLTTREGWPGDYDFGYLCLPQLPCSFGRGKKEVRNARFYGLDESMPLLLALVCGLQHALAMLAGLITPPIIFAGQLGFDGGRQNQMVAVSLIASGFLSMIQMTRMPIPFTRKKYWLGTGLITVVGTSFATLSTASAIFAALYADGTCPSSRPACALSCPWPCLSSLLGSSSASSRPSSPAPWFCSSAPNSSARAARSTGWAAAARAARVLRLASSPCAL